MPGYAEEWGDGIVPISAALLAGSEQVVLEGVYHSPIGAVDVQPDGEHGGTAAAADASASVARPWYGSASVINQWLHYACDSAVV